MTIDQEKKFVWLLDNLILPVIFFPLFLIFFLCELPNITKKTLRKKTTAKKTVHYTLGIVLGLLCASFFLSKPVFAAVASYGDGTNAYVGGLTDSSPVWNQFFDTNISSSENLSSITLKVWNTGSTNCSIPAVKLGVRWNDGSNHYQDSDTNTTTNVPANDEQDLTFNFLTQPALSTVNEMFVWSSSAPSCRSALRVHYGTSGLPSWAGTPRINGDGGAASPGLIDMAINGTFAPPDPRTLPQTTTIYPANGVDYAMADIGVAPFHFDIDTSLPAARTDVLIKAHVMMTKDNGTDCNIWTGSGADCVMNEVYSNVTYPISPTLYPSGSFWHIHATIPYLLTTGTYHLSSCVEYFWTTGEDPFSPLGPYDNHYQSCVSGNDTVNGILSGSIETSNFTVSGALSGPAPSTIWGVAGTDIGNFFAWLFIPPSTGSYGLSLKIDAQDLNAALMTKQPFAFFYQVHDAYQTAIDNATLSGLPSTTFNIPGGVNSNINVPVVVNLSDTQIVNQVSPYRSWFNTALYIGWFFWLFMTILKFFGIAANDTKQDPDYD